MAREVLDKSHHVATLAPAFSGIGGMDALRALTRSLNGVIGMLRVPEAETPIGSGRRRLTRTRISAEPRLTLTNDGLDCAGTRPSIAGRDMSISTCTNALASWPAS